VKRPGSTAGSAGVSPASSEQSEWRSRGYLPHRDAPELVQMVTFRLADSLPAEVMEELRRDPCVQSDAHRRERAEAYLDAGHGACHLRNPDVARMVENALLRHDSERYRLLAWSIMPNHVHVLIELLPGVPPREGASHLEVLYRPCSESHAGALRRLLAD